MESAISRLANTHSRTALITPLDDRLDVRFPDGTNLPNSSGTGHRLHPSYQAVLDATCAAWQQLTPERLRSLCAYPWIRKVTE